MCKTDIYDQPGVFRVDIRGPNLPRVKDYNYVVFANQAMRFQYDESVARYSMNIRRTMNGARHNEFNIVNESRSSKQVIDESEVRSTIMDG